METYVHGYSAPETRRLTDQADTLAAILHAGTRFPADSKVLEAGCGVGAQTGHLLRNSPGIRLTSIDVSAESLAQARKQVTAGVDWRHTDLFAVTETFDHVFVCFVLEHLTEPEKALAHLKTLLRPGGTITVIEGDHDTAVYHPASDHARAVIDAAMRLQTSLGGDPRIGRRLFPLLDSVDYQGISVHPCTIYADVSRPEMVQGFTLDTFTAMFANVREGVLAKGLCEPGIWDKGIADLRRTAEGTFHYTFFKATAHRDRVGTSTPSASSRARTSTASGTASSS